MKNYPYRVLHGYHYSFPDEGAANHAWSMTDPRTPGPSEAIETVLCNPSAVTPHQINLLRSIFEAYDHLLHHPAGTEVVVKQLRQMRAALKTEKKKEGINNG